MNAIEKALLVLLSDRAISKWLRTHDPKAYAQAYRAIDREGSGPASAMLKRCAPPSDGTPEEIRRDMEAYEAHESHDDAHANPESRFCREYLNQRGVDYEKKRGGR